MPIEHFDALLLLYCRIAFTTLKPARKVEFVLTAEHGIARNFLTDCVYVSIGCVYLVLYL